MGDEANLPDLKARVVLDATGAKSEVDALDKKIQSVGKQSSSASSNNIFANLNKSAKSTASNVDGITKRLGNLVVEGTKVGKGLEQGVFGPLGTLAGDLPIVGGLALGVVGLFGALDHLATTTANYSSQVLKNSQLLGMNTEQYQGLAAAASKFDVGQSQLLQIMIRFQRNLEQGAPQLKSMGLSLKDIGVTSSDTGTALNQVSTYLHNNTDATQRNAVAVAVLGKGGASLLQILSQGPQFLQRYTEELKHWGIVLDDNQLKTSAMAKVVDDQFHMALKGLQMQVGTQLEEAFSRLYLSILHALGPDPQRAFQNIGKAIANVVGWVVGLIDGLFGLKISMAELVGLTGSANAALDGLASAQDAATTSTDTQAQSLATAQAALEALRYTTTQQTQAIDDQIKILDRQYSALDNQYKMQDLLQQQEDEQHQTVLQQLQDRLDLLQSVNDSRRRSGESVLDYERRMNIEALKDDIKKEQDKRTQAKNTQAIQLEQLKQSTDAQKATLEDQKTNIERYLADYEHAHAKALGNINALDNSSANNFAADMTSNQTVADEIFKNINSNGQGMGEKFGETLRGMGGDVTTFLGQLNAISGAIQHLDQAIGAMGDGLSAAARGAAQATGGNKALTKTSIDQILAATSIDQINQIGNATVATNSLDQYQYDLLALAAKSQGEYLNHDPKSGYNDFLTLQANISKQGYADGGDPPINVPYLVGERGPEVRIDRTPGTIIPHEKIGGNVTYNTTFTGPVADEAVAGRIEKRWEAKRLSEGRANSAGVH